MQKEDNDVFLFFPHLLLGPDIVDLEDHLDELGGELDLGLLAVEGLDDALLLHVAGAHLHAVNTKCRVALGHLPEKDREVIYRFFFFTGPPLKKTKYKIMLEYPNRASPGPPQKVKVYGLGLP